MRNFFPSHFSPQKVYALAQASTMSQKWKNYYLHNPGPKSYNSIPLSFPPSHCWVLKSHLKKQFLLQRQHHDFNVAEMERWERSISKDELKLSETSNDIIAVNGRETFMIELLFFEIGDCQFPIKLSMLT